MSSESGGYSGGQSSAYSNSGSAYNSSAYNSGSANSSNGSGYEGSYKGQGQGDSTYPARDSFESPGYKDSRPSRGVASSSGYDK